jgi:hypothetical protein|nr:hypothetical protein HAGR004_24870 [Bdellovibrio sp. HAGR004]
MKKAKAKAKPKSKPKQKPLEKRIVRIQYRHVIVRACLNLPLGLKAKEIRNLSSVRLIAVLFQADQDRVAKDIARLNATVTAMFEKEESERKAKK